MNFAEHILFDSILFGVIAAHVGEQKIIDKLANVVLQELAGGKVYEYVDPKTGRTFRNGHTLCFEQHVLFHSILFGIMAAFVGYDLHNDQTRRWLSHRAGNNTYTYEDEYGVRITNGCGEVSVRISNHNIIRYVEGINSVLWFF